MNFDQIEPKYIVIAAIGILAVVVLAIIYTRNRAANRAQLRERFGPEYNRAVQEHGSERRAEEQLASRAKRIDNLNIRELTPIECDRFTNQWNALQLRFVDSPKGAVAEADDLIAVVMQTRGYPMSNFEQRAADISVDHPVVVENYRAAHTIATRVRNDEAGTEDLRRAMVHYRSLFEEMVTVSTVRDRTRDVA
jgi:type II secretory pathway pseudopilin PulG